MSDVVLDKNALRKKAKKFRESLLPCEKHKKDEIIFNKIISMSEYKNSDTVLCYYSTTIEVDTLKLIDYSLTLGKRVALPRCIDDKGKMNFYYINSIDTLKTGAYGIKEPAENSEIYLGKNGDLCIVPSLMIDKMCYRLGYGKGYYDNFLQNFSGIKCVICYKENVADILPVYDGFDVKCDMCITD